MQHIEPQASRATVAQEAHTVAHIPELIEGELIEGAPYAGKQLAAELTIGESTFRTRWLPWLQKVAPVELLKTDEGYTELARSLALEFKQVPSKKAQRDRWVSEAKERYSREFMPGGVTPEGVSEELGGALALLRDQGGKLQTAADEQLQQLQALIESQSQVEAEFDAAEVESMRAAGMKRGVTRFQIETEAEDTAYYQLRKARSQARTSQSGKS
ncbi:hypothetical protein PN498_28310 [Oscillatoria sp. CS-180]|uniref:hypothetical protein n=1 Tax=Oscillatoria sp. CS-180 TaxID=3021720 RepID=UPI00232F7B89|nr:hypothetical protein [Oscillatoria sp. CS-180]MDB9529923.1 hypothetical protein [Oscillatoria sp. CS-180]